MTDLLKNARDVFDEAADLHGEARARLLDNRCQGNAELRDMVERLLAEHDRGLGAFLEQPALTLPAAGGGDADYVPAQIGAYEIVRVVGQGGMGIVYEARQENPRRTVALKVIRPALASGSMLRRFSQEATVLGQLQHPGIACIYEAGVADVRTPSGAMIRQPYFAMELVRGRPLRPFVESHRLNTAERLELVARICDAVQHAHQKGVIHRDLKPGNILVVEDETIGSRNTGAGTSRAVSRDLSTGSSSTGHFGPTPKILDFGVARVTEADTTMVTQQTDVGQLIGTIPYMSPEQVAGDPSQIDTRSDVYAIGVILYELLSGRLPHDVARYSIPEAARVIREEEPTRLSTLNSAYRGDIDVIVSKAMEKDRERRYGSAAELAADIRRHLRDEPLVARAPSAMYRLRKFARRNRAIVAGTVAAFVALAAGLIVAVNFAIREGNQRRLAQQAELRANQQRDLAEKRFEDVRQLARAMIFKVHDQIKDLPGATPARKLIVETGLTYLDALAAQAGDNAVLLKDLAGSYKRLAAVQGDPTGANLGDLNGAMETYRKSLEACEKLKRLEPDNPIYAVGPTTILSCIANVQIGLGRQDEALASYEAALRIAEENHRRFPDDDVIAEDHAQCAVNIGRMHESAGRIEQALPLYLAFRDFLSGRIEKDPDDGSAALNFSVIESRIGSMLRAMGRDEEALPHFEESVRVVRQVAKDIQSPEANMPLQARLTDALIHLGRAYSGVNQFDKAFPPIREALENRRMAVEVDAKNVRTRRGLAVAYEALGSVYYKQGQLKQALAAYETFRDLTAAMCKEHPDSSYSQHDLGLALNNIGKTRFHMAQWQDAIEPLVAAYEQFQVVVKASPNQAATENDLVEPCGHLALIYEKLYDDGDRPISERREHLRQCREWAQRCVDLASALRTRKIFRSESTELAAESQRVLDRFKAETSTPEATDDHPSKSAMSGS